MSGALLSDTIVGKGFREGTKGLLATATAAAVVINRVVNRVQRFKEANEETRNEHNTMSYECTRILLNYTIGMTIQRIS